jgi:hypothetical protein
MAAAAYVLVAAAGSAGPFITAIEQAQTVEAHPALAQRLPEPPANGGPIPDAPDSPAERIAKAVGVEVLLLAGPPLLLLWFGWDVWFALAGFLPGLGAGGKRAPPAERE